MRVLLTIAVVLGLILNSGTAGFAKTSARAAESAHGAHHKTHVHSKSAVGCHNHASTAPAQKHDCCGKDSKCTHDGCACVKCLSLLVEVRPTVLSGLAFPALHQTDRFAKPPDDTPQPPARPPQSWSLRTSQSAPAEAARSSLPLRI